MMWLWASMLAFGGDACSNAELSTAIAEAERAFEALDQDAFRRAARSATSIVDCLQNPISPALAASYHRVGVLRAFLDRDLSSAYAGIVAMHRADPGTRWPASLVPEGHPLRTWETDALEQPSTDSAALPAAPEGWLTVDGRKATKAPTTTPYVFQWQLDRSTVARSAALAPGQSPPPLTAVTTPRAKAGGRGLRKGLGLGLAALGAGALLATFPTANQADQAFQDGDLDREGNLANLNHALFIGGAAGLVGGTVVFVVP